MKPVDFDYARPASVAEALQMLGANAGAKVLAGGQTLGPMLNLRLAQPALLLDITRIRELGAVTEKADAITLGATVTHAAIEDGRAPDSTGGFLARVARGIAYRAVRTRGTIGGSLAHADPAADWLSCLTALGADVLIAGQRATRTIPVARFVRGALQTELADDELLAGVGVPRFSSASRFGFHKICRKAGEFADAIGVAVHDPEHGLTRLVASTPAGAPILIENVPFNRAIPDTVELEGRLTQAGFSGDAFELKLRAVALRRAALEALAP